MKVCYIILTCEMYIFTRVKWQKNTFLKEFNKNDIYYVANKKYNFLGVHGENIYGWDTTDRFSGGTLKFIKFIKNMDVDYDWYVFIHDDSFLHNKNLRHLLMNYDSKNKICIGKSCIHDRSKKFFMSGGAGFVLSKPLYNELCEYVCNNDDNELCIHNESDLSIFSWLKNIENIEYVDVDKFHIETHNNEDELNEFISFHHLKSENQYEEYLKLTEDAKYTTVAPYIEEPEPEPEPEPELIVEESIVYHNKTDAEYEKDTPSFQSFTETEENEKITPIVIPIHKEMNSDNITFHFHEHDE